MNSVSYNFCDLVDNLIIYVVVEPDVISVIYDTGVIGKFWRDFTKPLGYKFNF